MTSREPEQDSSSTLYILLFIGLLVAKALDAPLDWWIVTSPLTGRFAYLFITHYFKQH